MILQKNQATEVIEFLNQTKARPKNLGEIMIEKSYTYFEKEFCFIASATYGDYNHPTVLIFRYYRDNVLMKKQLGRILISIYYNFSPSVAKAVARNSILKQFSKKILDLIAKNIQQKY